MSKSDFLEAKMNDHILGGPDYVRAATVYLALWKGSPGDAGASGAEVSGGSYARIAVVNNATNWPATTVGTGAKSNGTAIVFATPSVDWSSSFNDVTHFAIFDALSGCN